MTDVRHNPDLRDLAVFAERFATHPADGRQLDELHDRGSKLAGDHRASADLAELAANFQDSAQHRVELARSAREVLKHPEDPMRPAAIIAIGCYLMALGVVTLAVLPWAWSLAAATMTAAPGTAARAHFLGIGFTPTTEFSLVLIVILMAVLGSVAVMALTFSGRAGHATLERGYLWWYLTRPVVAGGAGVLFYMTIVAGYFSQASAQGRTALVVAAAIGGLAGLFTDQVLQKMRGILGQKPFDTPVAGTADTTSQ